MLRGAYYNEWMPYPAAVLRKLIAQGLIPAGEVDERSIKDVKAEDLKGFAQCHFFAGIGGWPLALRLAGWPDERPVWTGSCPCQPFSVAGKEKAQSDERHLWPDWAGLIGELRPATIFGEQVTGAIAKGWVDDVAHDLEEQDYAFASEVLPACSVGARHKRDRVWFLGDTQYNGLFASTLAGSSQEASNNLPQRAQSTRKPARAGRPGSCSDVEDTDCGGLPRQGFCPQQPGGAEVISSGETLANDDGSLLSQPTNKIRTGRTSVNLSSRWAIEPDVGRVAHGIPNRVDRLKALGNAIVPQVAAEFIMSFMEVSRV